LRRARAFGPKHLVVWQSVFSNALLTGRSLHQRAVGQRLARVCQALSGTAGSRAFHTNHQEARKVPLSPHNVHCMSRHVASNNQTTCIGVLHRVTASVYNPYGKRRTHGLQHMACGAWWKKPYSEKESSWHNRHAQHKPHKQP